MGAETWRPVVGYEGAYEVSDLGRVHLSDCPERLVGGACDCGGDGRKRVTSVWAVRGWQWIGRTPELESMWWSTARRRFIQEYRDNGLRQVRRSKETVELDEGQRMVRLIVEGWAA